MDGARVESGASPVAPVAPTRWPQIGDAVLASLRATGPVWAVWLITFIVALAISDATGLNTRPDAAFAHFLRPLFWYDWAWYWNISQSSYATFSPGSYAYFPLWVLLLKAASPGPEQVVAAVVANVSALFAFAGIAAAAPGLPAWRSALAVACFPGSFTLALAYPDAFALATATWACVLALRGKPLAAAVLAALAGMARPNAFLLAIPLGAVAIAKGGRFWLSAVAPVAASALVHAWFWWDSGVWDAFVRAERTTFFRKGPFFGLDRWQANLRGLADHPARALALAAAALLLGILFFLVPRRFRTYVLAAAYLVVATAVVLSAGSDITRLQTAFIVMVLPLCAFLWLMGRDYRVWALYATAVVGLSLSSGIVWSFGRQALFAFPIFWAIAGGPRLLRSPPALAAGFAANIVWALLALPRYPP